MKKELWDALKKTASSDDLHSYINVTQSDAFEIVYEIENRQPFTKWILATDPPKHPNWVIAYNPIVNQGAPCPAWYSNGRWHIEMDEDWDINLPVLWSELPPSPKSETP